MAIIPVFYAAFGYLTLLAAILWGMLFVGDGVDTPLMDAPSTATPLAGILIDLGLLLLLALVHRLVGRGMLRHGADWAIPPGLVCGSRAWAAALGLVLIYAGWRSVPQVLWNATGALQWAISGLFYLAWTLVLIGAFLPGDATGKATFPGTLRQPLYGGIILAMWTTSVMTVGHLLLATMVTVYLLFDGVWEARSTAGARGQHRSAHSRASASRVSA
jgi:protein-S-isoprenylcysteine O-methyltransferase Ste14